MRHSRSTRFLIADLSAEPLSEWFDPFNPSLLPAILFYGGERVKVSARGLSSIFSIARRCRPRCPVAPPRDGLPWDRAGKIPAKGSPPAERLRCQGAAGENG